MQQLMETPKTMQAAWYEKQGAAKDVIQFRRLGQPNDVALVAFLASPDADYITSSTFYVDGGLLWNYQEQ
jgi:glucose 1-dehydrogenase